MTPIQAESLPHILSGRDVIGHAKTGSGKTAAFGLGLLSRLKVKQFRIQSLVLCPTRELADQVATEIRRLGRAIHNIKVLTLCGGVPLGPQIGSLQHGAHIVVGTPGRINDLLRKNLLSLDHLTSLVLDEADRMLDMGFQDVLQAIVKKVPRNRQTLLFSATFPDKIRSISADIMRDPVTVKVAENVDRLSITQHFYKVDGKKRRIEALCTLLAQYSSRSTLIFCNTKVQTQSVSDALGKKGFSVMALHGDLEQRDRDRTLIKFANKSLSILVATDVAARGLDIIDLDLVINYQLGQDPNVHTHRIGRTGRAGKSGLAISLYTENDGYKVALLEDHFGDLIEKKTLPSPVHVASQPEVAAMATLQIDGGKKQKVRPGDILGALTGENGITGKQVGKIQVFDQWTYVAVDQSVAKSAMRKLVQDKIKGRIFRVRRV